MTKPTKTIYFKGDKCKPTGSTLLKRGGVFVEVKMLEGLNKGELRYITPEHYNIQVS